MLLRYYSPLQMGEFIAVILVLFHQCTLNLGEEKLTVFCFVLVHGSLDQEEPHLTTFNLETIIRTWAFHLLSYPIRLFWLFLWGVVYFVCRREGSKYLWSRYLLWNTVSLFPTFDSSFPRRLYIPASYHVIWRASLWDKYSSLPHFPLGHVISLLNEMWEKLSCAMCKQKF